MQCNPLRFRIRTSPSTLALMPLLAEDDWVWLRLKLKFLPRMCFHAISSSFSALSDSLFPTNQNGQAAYAAPHKPLVCFRVSSCPLVSFPFVCLCDSWAFWTASKKPMNHKKHKRHKKRKLIKQTNYNSKISNNLFLSQQNRKNDEIA